MSHFNDVNVSFIELKSSRGDIGCSSAEQKKAEQMYRRLRYDCGLDVRQLYTISFLFVYHISDTFI